MGTIYIILSDFTSGLDCGDLYGEFLVYVALGHRNCDITDISDTNCDGIKVYGLGVEGKSKLFLVCELVTLVKRHRLI